MPLGERFIEPSWTCLKCSAAPVWWTAKEYHVHVRAVHPEVHGNVKDAERVTAHNVRQHQFHTWASGCPLCPPGEDDVRRDVRASILEQAKKLVTENRNKSYGEPENNFKRIASLWNSYLQGKHSEWQFDLDPSDVAIMMVLMKIARLEENTENWDSWLDAIGYLACGAQTIWDNPPEA